MYLTGGVFDRLCLPCVHVPLSVWGPQILQRNRLTAIHRQENSRSYYLTSSPSLATPFRWLDEIIINVRSAPWFSTRSTSPDPRTPLNENGIMMQGSVAMQLAIVLVRLSKNNITCPSTGKRRRHAERKPPQPQTSLISFSSNAACFS